MADDLPIDIDYVKFLDWLVDRRRVSRGWYASLKAARVLLRSAEHELPENSQLSIPRTYFDVIDALAIIADKSKQPPFEGASDTDVLGRYTHPASRALSSAKSSYESGSAYLAEAAQLLVRNADVEAPAIRADMSRCKETIAECARKEGPTIRAASDAKDRFHAACAEYDVNPDDAADFETSVQSYIDKKAPDLLRAAVMSVKDERVIAALQHYGEFVEYTCSPVASDDGMYEETTETSLEVVCPTLREVVDGQEESLIRATLKENSSGVTAGIDWGSELEVTGGGNDSGGVTEVDWGIEIDASGTAVADEAASTSAASINRGDESTATTTIHSDDSTAAKTPNTAKADVKDVGESKPAGGITLSDKRTREQLSNDLLELKAFLTQRQAELSRAADTQVSLVLQQAGSVPARIRDVDTSRVSEMLSGVSDALENVCGSDVRRILALQQADSSSTNTYGNVAEETGVQRVARGLAEKMRATRRVEASIQALGERKLQASNELAALQPQFEALACGTRTLIRRVEENLRELYRGREVNILGDINVTFPADEYGG